MLSEELLFPRAMSERDALLWRLERDPTLRSTIVTVALLDRPPSLEHARATLRRAIRRIPRLRQRVATPPIGISTPLWIDVDAVDLDHHHQHLCVPAGAGFEPVLELAATMGGRPFEPDRPLWEAALVEGLPGDAAALVLKLHHAMTDGVAGVLLMGQFFDREQAGPPAEAHDPKTRSVKQHDLSVLTSASLLRRIARHSTQLRRQGRALRGAVAAPGAAVRQGAEELRSLARIATLAEEPLSPLMRGRSQHFDCRAFSISLSSLRAAAHQASCKVNDAFLAGVAGGLQRYHRDHGHEIDSLRMAMPISLRPTGAPGSAGNDISVARVDYPVAEPNPVEQMRTSRRLTAELLRQPAIRHAEAVAGFANLLPAGFASRLMASQARGSDFVASCVRGPDQPLYFARSKLERFFAFGPAAGAAINITLVSYLDGAQVGIRADLAAVRDADALVASMKEGFDAVLKFG